MAPSSRATRAPGDAAARTASAGPTAAIRPSRTSMARPAGPGRGLARRHRDELGIFDDQLHRPALREQLEPTLYAAVMAARSRRARIGDVHELAMGMPHVTIVQGPQGQPHLPGRRQVLRVFPHPPPGRRRPGHGGAVPGRDHVLGHVRGRQAGAGPGPGARRSSPRRTSTATRRCWSGPAGSASSPSRELAEVVQDAWLSRASPARAAAWLSARN